MEKQLYNEFKKHIVQTGLIKPGEKVLLTVSGGIDSVALFHLFLETGTDFAVAHCNFQLRGEEANGDQKFVENLAAAHHIICYTQKFNTKEYASDNKISIQMAARDLRYTWFEEIATENAFQKIATAHNLNDVVETFFLNLTRGTGLKGLSGIKQLKGKLVRPLLFASRNEITEYVKAKNISYREDSSNAETKYMRNAIRHNIVPAFEKLNPSFIRSVLHSSRIIAEAEKVFDKHVGHLKSQLLCTNEGFTYIDVEKLKELNISAELLFELISPYGFSFGNAENIIESLDSQSGISFFSEKYQVLKDRGRFIFKEISKVSQQEFFIQETTEELHQPINLKIKRFGVCPNFVIKKNKNVASFDASLLKFPLKIRHWEKGDYFYPFGMKGRKKLSDYFTDHKFSVFDKESTWILLSGNDIIWITGHRADNRYKVTEKTREIVQIECID